MKKRILSLFLVLVMALSLLPAQVFAASYTFDPNATIFTQNFTTETPRPNNLGEYFTVTSTPLSTADHTTTWNTGKNGTSVNIFNQNGSQKLGDTHAVLTFTFQKSCTFWFKFLFSISNSAPNSYAELFLNGSSLAKGTSSSKLTSPYSLDVKAGDVFKIDFYSEDDFGTPCQMTLKNIRCTDLAAQDVTVSFDPNQSSTRGTVSGAMAAQTVPAGTATALNANAFTNVYSMKISGTEFGGNVRFLGWNTAADGSGDSYADGADIAVSADTTLYAQWAGQNVTTHFEAGYPDAPAIADTISIVGSQYVIPEQPTRTQDGVEYKFVGWYTFPEGGEAITEKNATYGKPYIVRSMARATQEEANNGSVTFYARWVKRLSVSFDGNGYTGAFGTNNTWYTSQIDNQLKSVTENMFKSWNIGKVPVGKDFEGWYVKNADGSFGDKVYPLETPYNFTEKIPGDSMTLIANWVDKPVQDVTVSFDANGGEGTMAAQTLTEGKGTLNANTFTRENFRFAGWALSAAGEKVYDDGAAVELTADTTLYALWEAVQADLPVHFDGNGYQESIPNAAIGADGHVTLPTLSSAKFPSGQKYYDWYIVLADGTLGDRVTASYDFSAYRESGVTLKAQWYSRSYIICYHARTVDTGVTGSMDDQRAPFDQKIHLSACTLMREGYTFAGWSTSASIYGKVEYADGAELLREWSDGEWDDWEEDYVDGSEDGEHFDLYACWTKNMSDEEKAAREKLDAAKKLLEKTYQPSFKTDKNLLTMAQARLTAGNVEGVTVAMKSAVTQKDLFTDARAGIDLDGTLHYKWNDNGSTSASSLYCRATLLLTCNGYTDEVQDATVILGLDEDKALEALRTQGRRIVIPQELNDSTTLTSVPHYMVKEGVDESTVDYNSSSDLHLWAEVTWKSSNTSIIGISNNNSKLFAPYTVKVSRPKTDTDVTLTAALTYSGRDDLKVYFTYTVKVKGTQKAIDYQEALELWLAGGKEEPFGALYVPATGDPIDVDRVVTDIHFPTTSDMREIFAANYGADFDGKYTPILITSNNESVVQSLDANAARAWVYRPLPGQADAKVTLTVKILSRPSGSGKDYANMQVLASKDIPITVPAMSQSDIDAAAAFMREVCTEDVYWEGIRKANTDHSFVTGNLWPFMEIVPDGNGYKFIRTSAESQWTGVKVDDIDGWYDSQQYRCFRSSVPSVVAHETLLVTKPRYNTHVKIDSVLTYVEYGKYYEKFGSDPAYAQFKQFYKQPVSTVVTVIGTTGIEDPSIQDITVTVNVTGSTFAPDFTDLTAASYTCKSNAYKTAWDALESALTASSYTYEGSGSYVTAVTDAAGCRLGSGDPAHGPYSGWMFTVNGSMPMLDSETYATLGKYLLQANDRIDFYYVNCPSESGDHSWTEDTALRHEPTCTLDGSASYKCTMCGDTKTETLPAIGHKYGEPAWSWTGVESATATFTCENDASHKQVVNATITSKVTKPATCTEDGVRTYTATVTFEGKTYTDTKTEAIKVTGHKYGEPVWSWTGVESATATFTCVYDATHTQVVNATITNAVTKPATCTEDGVRTYTATVTFEGKTYTDTKTETIKATGEHTWDEGKVTTEPTCTEKGIKTYTCKKCSATKTEEINALGHDYVTKRIEPTCTEDGKLEEACSRCGDVKYSRVIPATGHNFRKNAQTGKYVCENCGKVLGESENTKPTKPTTPTKPGKDDTKFPFIDVSKNDRYYDAVDYLYNNGIMNGTTDTLFSPNAELTRAMVVTILYRAQGKPAVSTSGSFKDVAAGRYYTEAVEWAAANNIVKGFTDGTFKPDEPVTREQLAAFISRYAEYNGIEIVAADGKLDADAVVSNWAKKNVEWAVAEGILTSAQAKNATQNATRAEVAMALYTYLTKVAK